MRAPATGVRRKLWAAFILQVAAISFATVLGVYAAFEILRGFLVEEALQREADYLWQKLDADPRAALPDTYNLKAYLSRDGGDDGLPPEVHGFDTPGFHELPGQDVLVHVSRQPGIGTLYLLFDEDQVDRLALWFGGVPLIFVLLSIYLVTWVTYRVSRRVVSPITWLADVVRRWDPKRPALSELDPQRMPYDADEEVEVLAQALRTLGTRMEAFVSRERYFTRDVSHELRSPLTVVRIAAEMLEADPSLSPLARRSVHRIRAAARDMEALVESLLVLAREASEGDFHVEHLVINDIVHDEVEKARAMVADKPVDLSLETPCTFAVHASARVVSVVLGNLLRNACIFTPAGRIRVVVGEGSITVADTGLGMGEPEVEHAFDPDYRVTHQHKSSRGIGLPLVGRLVRRFGWKVAIESSPDGGTTIVWTLPEAERVEC